MILLWLLWRSEGEGVEKKESATRCDLWLGQIRLKRHSSRWRVYGGDEEDGDREESMVRTVVSVIRSSDSCRQRSFRDFFGRIHRS